MPMTETPLPTPATVKLCRPLAVMSLRWAEESMAVPTCVATRLKSQAPLKLPVREAYLRVPTPVWPPIPHCEVPVQILEVEPSDVSIERNPVDVGIAGGKLGCTH